MDLRQMEYLLAVAEERHFTRAAELAGISQSGLSSAIRNLEKELGTPLFDRTTRRVELTEAGLALLPYARQMLADATQARDAVIKASQEVTGFLRIGAEQCLGFVDVADLLERFHRRHPRVETHFTQAGSQDLIALTRAGEIDVAFVATTKHLGALPHRILGREPLMLLAAPDHPLAARASVRPEVPWDALDGEDFIDFTGAWGIRELNDETLAMHGVHRRVRCTVNDVHTLLDLVTRGLGVAIVPRHVAAKPQAVGLRMVALPPTAGPSWVVSAVSAPHDHVAAPSTHLLELLADLGATTETHLHAG
ncbi:LysR family transcriptional regulator [Microbacterium murale]|uniref:DNA-binding transcriptional LysR family regulator n=1 Tax=Microbacterium murale TaxID=1081040 RepID=A0ABU0PAB0_9MICO|nr:LysR family transcriptional regulator [Microbacterium murale]MDQ0643554.1 DNA-binding transcriptional LysR family regulator [Microbacterium murale]